MSAAPVPDNHAHPSKRDAVDIVAFEAELARDAAALNHVTINSVTAADCDCNCSSIPIAHSASDNNLLSITRTTSNIETEPTTPLTLANLLTKLSTTLSQAPQAPPHVEVELVIYDARTGTATARLSVSSSAPLTKLFAAFPCSSNTPSSAVLFVNNLFYEYVHPSCADYSSHIADFISTHSKTWRKPPSIVRFSNSDDVPLVRVLRPKLGQPYLYIHDNDCQHRLIFTDVRSARSNAAQPGNVRALSIWQPRVQACDVCFVRAATVAVFSDPIAPSSPFHYCNPCFKRAHPDRYERAQLTCVKHPQVVPVEEE